MTFLAFPDRPLAIKNTRMRQCPTLRGDERPLITHSIASCLCMERQRDFYHKCHRCEFGGKAADFTLPSTNGTNGAISSAKQPADLVVEAPHAGNGVAARRDMKDPRDSAAAPEFREASADAGYGG